MWSLRADAHGPTELRASNDREGNSSLTLAAENLLSSFVVEISLIVAHPSRESLTHALASAVADALASSGHQVRWHALAEECFDPRATSKEIVEHRSDDPLVELHCRELGRAEGLVLVHPVWFAQPPAVLKGWIDRVVREGVAFHRTPEGAIEPLLKANTALLITTANTTYDSDRGDALDRFWKDVVLSPCGVARLERLAFAPVVSSTAGERAAWIRDAARTAAAIFAPLGACGEGQVAAPAEARR